MLVLINEPGLSKRIVFDGKEILDSEYLGKLITNIVKIGQNPVITKIFKYKAFSFYTNNE